MITLPDGTQYRVILHDHLGDPGADSSGRIEITNNIQVLEVFDGAPISATITLNAVGGRYRTYAPIIQKWDRIYIEINDINSNQFRTVVHVQDREPNRQSGSGLQLILTCPHQSSNLMTRTISKPNLARLQRASSGYNALNDAFDQINDNSGTSDPIIVGIGVPFVISTKIGNDLDQSLSNDYIFESERFDQVVNDILNKEGDARANGGGEQFHYFRFQSKYDYTNVDDLQYVVFQVFPQGYHDVSGSFVSTPTTTIMKNALGSPPSIYQNTKGKLESERATNLIAIGDKNSGSYPKDYSICVAQNDQLITAQAWNSSLIYLQDSLVTRFTAPGINTVYKALSVVPAGFTPETNPLYWQPNPTIITYDYSPLTKNKAQYWINNGAGWINAATENEEVSVVDPNVIIQDQYHPRTWVDAVGLAPTDSAVTSCFDNSVMPNVPFDGLRILVAGTGTGAWAGNDPTGLPFSNNVVEYVEEFPGDPNGGWYVADWIILQNDMEVFSYRECLSWIYNPANIDSLVDGSGNVWVFLGYPLVQTPGGRQGGWVAGSYIGAQFAGAGFFGVFDPLTNFDCAHPVQHNTGANALIGNSTLSSVSLPNPTNSAVFAIFDPSFTDNNTQNAPFTRGVFMGLNFAWPFPRNGNGIPYGGVTVGEKIALRVFDMLNMYLDHTGGREWFGPNVEDYYPIQSIHFFELLQDFFLLGIPQPQGNYKMGVWIADRKDNVVVIQYTHGHNMIEEDQDAPIGSIKIYRGVPGMAGWLPAQIPEVLNIFDFRSAIRGGIFSMDSYNDQGQYVTLPPGPLRFALSTSLHIYIDAFRMIKPLVATNLTDPSSLPTRNIEPQKIQASSIIDYLQLSNMVNALNNVYVFEPHNYTVNTKGRCGDAFGDPVYYTDSELIDVTTDTFANTEKCVVDGITYTISKGLDGPGGFNRALSLITRLWPS